MPDISSKGDLKWEYTRDEENNKGIKVKNKLDVIAISNTLIKQCKTIATRIGDPSGLSEAITDHKLLNARLKTKKFQESKPHRLRMAAATNKAASGIRKAR